MVLIEKRNIKRNLTLSIILIIFLVILFIVLQRQFSASDHSLSNVNVSSGSLTGLPVTQDLGEDLFKDLEYQGLKKFGDLPVEEGNKGRNNPFIPPRF